MFLPVLVCFGAVFAQTEMDEMSASGLLSEAGSLLADEQYRPAVPYLKKYLERMEDVEDDRVQVLTQKVRLKLGKLMAWLEDPQSAVGYLEDYTERLPRYRPREAYKLLAVNLYAVDQYAEAISAATHALTRPLPVGLKTKKKKTVDYDQMTEKERGGFSARQLRRIEQGVGSEESDLSTGLSAEVPDPEGDFPTQDLVLLNMTLAESYAKLGQWPASIEPYTYVVEHAEEEDRRGFAVMQLVNALVVLERFDEAADLIVELSGTDSRYDIRVNMAMMTAAKALFGAQDGTDPVSHMLDAPAGLTLRILEAGVEEAPFAGLALGPGRLVCIDDVEDQLISVHFRWDGDVFHIRQFCFRQVRFPSNIDHDLFLWQ